MIEVEALFRSEYRRLVGLARLLVDDVGQAEEVVQVPPTPATALDNLAHGAPLLEDVPELVVFEQDGWRAWVPYASTT